MLSGVVYYTRIRDPGLKPFRVEHDPYADLIEDHLTLVFPVPVDPADLCDHVQGVIEGLPPFDIHIAGVGKTWDQWMYLGVQEGSEDVVALHEQLYRGSLAQYRRRDLTFVPHVGIGFFGLTEFEALDPSESQLDEERYLRAKEHAEGLAIDEWRRVDELTVVSLTDDLSVLKDVFKIPLGGMAEPKR